MPCSWIWLISTCTIWNCPGTFLHIHLCSRLLVSAWWAVQTRSVLGFLHFFLILVWALPGQSSNEFSTKRKQNQSFRSCCCFTVFVLFAFACCFQRHKIYLCSWFFSQPLWPQNFTLYQPPPKWWHNFNPSRPNSDQRQTSPVMLGAVMGQCSMEKSSGDLLLGLKLLKLEILSTSFIDFLYGTLGELRSWTWASHSIIYNKPYHHNEPSRWTSKSKIVFSPVGKLPVSWMLFIT